MSQCSKRATNNSRWLQEFQGVCWVYLLNLCLALVSSGLLQLHPILKCSLLTLGSRIPPTEVPSAAAERDMSVEVRQGDACLWSPRVLVSKAFCGFLCLPSPSISVFHCRKVDKRELLPEVRIESSGMLFFFFLLFKLMKDFTLGLPDMWSFKSQLHVWRRCCVALCGRRMSKLDVLLLKDAQSGKGSGTGVATPLK